MSDAKAQHARSEHAFDTELLYKRLPHGCLTLDETGRIGRANPAAAGLFGVEAEQLSDRLLADFIEPGDCERIKPLYEWSAAGSTVPSVELWVRGRAETRVLLRFSALGATRDFGSSQRSYLMFVEDVGELRRLQARLRDSEKAIALAALSGGIAHHFNNLLMGMCGCFEVALAQLPEDSSLRPLLSRGLSIAQRSSKLTQRLARFSDTSQPGPRPVELDRAVEESGDLLQQVLGEHIDLNVSVGATGCHILADTGDIEHVLLTLAASRRTSMVGGGRLRIKTENRVLHEGSFTVEGVCLSLSDNGAPIAAKAQQMFGDPLLGEGQAHERLGLGLSAVEAIVERLNGRMTITCRAGQGATIALVFPTVLARDDARVSAPNSGRVPPPGAHVLVVEDNPLVRGIVSNQLLQLGYDVQAADGPLQVAAVCRERRVKFDFVVSDVLMAGTLGTKLAEAVRAMVPGVRILYMSAHPREQLVEHYALPNDAIFLLKPFAASELRLAISQLFEE